MTFEYLPKEDIYVIQGELPEGVEGFCKEIDSYKFACVSESLEDNEKIAAALHEIAHLENNDLYKEFEELKLI